MFRFGYYEYDYSPRAESPGMRQLLSSTKRNADIATLGSHL
jgi:hypothetical protein